LRRVARMGGGWTMHVVLWLERCASHAFGAWAERPLDR
jgi:hypothetical protein